MAEKKQKHQPYPTHQYGVWENDGDEQFLSSRDSIEQCVDGYNTDVEIAVYKLVKIVTANRKAEIVVKDKKL